MRGRVAIVGPESTGKSTLAAALAAHLGTVWVPEYARAYLDRLASPYDAADVARIGRGQIALEDAYAPRTNGLLICDTNLLVVKVWMEHAYGRATPWVLRTLRERLYDLWVLCGPDVPWTPDPQREHPHLRSHFFEVYDRELRQMMVPFVVVRGTPDERTRTVVEVLRRHC